MTLPKAEVPPEVMERFKKEYPTLALRVRDGNDKIIAAYLQIQDLTDEKIYNASMDKIIAALDGSPEKPGLHTFCLTLKVQAEVLNGKSDCLYVMNGKKVRKCQMYEKSPKGKLIETFCWVCPSQHPYWQEEWSAFVKSLWD
jgi:hypothetical protein